MKKIDIIKLMEENDKKINDFNRNQSKEHYMKKVKDYMEYFLTPELKKISRQDKLIYSPSTDNKETLSRTQIIENGALETINELGLEENIKDLPIFKNKLLNESDDKLNFLYTKDRKYKEQVAKIIANFIATNQKISMESIFFRKNHLIPILNKYIQPTDEDSELFFNVLVDTSTHLFVETQHKYQELKETPSKLDYDPIEADNRDNYNIIANRIINIFMEKMKDKSKDFEYDENNNPIIDVEQFLRK